MLCSEEYHAPSTPEISTPRRVALVNETSRRNTTEYSVKETVTTLRTTKTRTNFRAH